MEDNREVETKDLPISPDRRVDLVCDRFEAAWRRGERPSIERYLADLGESMRPGLLRELILLEVELRCESAKTPSSATDAARAEGLELFEEIGRGGMGTVLKGHDTDLRRDVAVKVLLEEHRHKPEMVRRFIEEAQIGGQLQHPGIVPVYGTGRLGDGRPYFSMKIIKGRTLSALLDERSGPPDDLPRFLETYRDICEALAYAHSRGVIHRDLKPLNVMVGAFGEVQVMDWGLAKTLRRNLNDYPEVAQPDEERTIITTNRDGSDRGQSGDASVKGGTPSYMAPEQAGGDDVDERCDVFALGSILCEILTGQPAFTGGSSAEVQRKAARGDLAEAFSRLEACGAEAELVGLARDALAPERGNRPRDAQVVTDRITAYLRGVQERLHAAGLARVEAETQAKEEGKRRVLADQLVVEVRQKSRTRLALAASVLVTMLLFGGGWYWIERGASARRGAVEFALGEARQLQERARKAPLDDLSGWAEALAKVKQAEGQLAGANEPALLRQVIALRGQIDAESRTARTEFKLLSDLEEILGRHAEHYDIKRTDAAFTAAFRTAGLDLDLLAPKEAAAAIARMQSMVKVTSFLDYWADLRWRMRRPLDQASWQRLIDIARKADPDPWRDALRAQFGVYELTELQRLADDAKGLQGQPVRSLILLAEELGNSGDDTGAMNLLQSAWRRNPRDFWLNYTLGYFSSPDPAEAVRYYTTAVAIRPQSYVAHIQLCYALLGNGKLDAAVDEFHETLKIKTDDSYALNGLGWALQAQTKFDDATNVYKQALRIKPDSADAHNGLGVILQKQGKLDEASDEYRKALSIDPSHSAAQENLASLPLDQRK